ncbi:helix-turn-helix domain-containing protein [Cupriavidus basilensis]|uniref:helix-turn-helix domain-containing protein n=1 Tax=Cupriavidus basilensis TaxID=68895 RepID=UPI0023E844E3|nr:LysR family transcriptional regulator [Cupriavidus basilensis]MDF3882514.1 LysR family transcriptional regulator [Cupriavidus basilensis]
MDKLLALKLFVETVDAKGFSSAARRINLATSSVTRVMDSPLHRAVPRQLSRAVSEAGAGAGGNADRRDRRAARPTH